MAWFPDRSSPDARFNQQGPGRRPGAYCAPRATPGAASYYLPPDLPAALFATLRPRLAVAFLLLLRAVFLAAGRLDLLAALRTVLAAGLRAAPPLDRKGTRLNPVTNAHLVCRLLLEKKKHTKSKFNTNRRHT